MKAKKQLTLKTLTKSSVWDVQENDVLRMWQAAEKDADLKDNIKHYLTIIRSAFELEEVKPDRQEVVKKYENRGFKVGMVKNAEGMKVHMAIKKKPIMRVTDLTYENIHHISATKLMEVLERNFGGGWESLPQSTQDIISSGFDISTTTLPNDRLHRPGGMYEKKVNDGYAVLEIPKGSWTEAIFAKAKPEVERPRLKFDLTDEDGHMGDDDDEVSERSPRQDDDDDNDDTYDVDKLTEESYRTTFDTDPEDLNLEATEVSDDDGDDY